MKKTLLFLTFGLLATLFVGSSDAQLIPRNRPQFVPAPVTAPLPMQAPVEVGGSKKLGPVACAAVRLELAKELRKKDPTLTRFAALRKAQDVADDDTINALRTEAEKVAGQKFGAIGDGTILQAIIDFFKSPQGQALIAALIQMLIHLIGA